MNNSRFRTPNPPLHRTSTVLFDSLAQLDTVTSAMMSGDRDATMYGTIGTPTTKALADEILKREGGAGVVFAPSGLGAVTLALLTVVKAGSHLLVPDSTYGPTREFCDTVLKRLGVQTQYYEPGIGAGIATLMLESTCAVFIESPGSFTFEFEDVPAMVAAIRAKRDDVHVVMDNAWGSPGLFSPLAHDVDISVVPLTKYWGGHADLLAGAVVAGSRSWKLTRETAIALGMNTNADEAFLALRGARSVDIRLRHHEAAALKVATLLKAHPRVGAVLHPAFPECPGHAIWKRDYSGSNGLFAFRLLDRAGGAADVQAVARFVDRLITDGPFSLGYSWGGYESLVMPAVRPGGPNITRTVGTSALDNLIRLHVGLEPVDSLAQALLTALEV